MCPLTKTSSPESLTFPVTARRLGQSYSFVDWVQLFRLINMGEIALATLQVLQLNPHHHSALPPIALFGAMRTKGPL